MGFSISSVEIFRAGDYGAKGSYTPDDLARIAADYDPENRHDAPLTVDHVQAGPALGWIRNVRAEGSSLFADFSDLGPETVAAIKERSFSKRSVELYPKFQATGRPYLKAVTMLGAAAPHVKGLRDIAFSDTAGDSVAFDDEPMTVSVLEFSTPASVPDAAPNPKEVPMPEPNVPGAAPPAAPAPDPAVVAKFAELESQLASERKAREAAEAKADATAKAFSEFQVAAFNERETARFEKAYDEALKAGRAVPANRATALAIFSALPADAAVVTFGEGQTGSPRDAYLHALSTAPVVVEFGDSLPPREARNGAASGRDAMDAAAKARAKEKNISFAEALVEIVTEKEAR